jgi:NAD(P) transhydrogenase subunit alpha
MKLLVLKENNPDEKRVSLTPDIISKYSKKNIEILIEQDAGKNSGFDDQDYIKSGAKIVENINNILPEIDIITSVKRWQIDFKNLKKNCCFISTSSEEKNNSDLNEDVLRNINLFSLDYTPRISRAQSIDVLSSQSNLVGYISVIEGIYHLKKIAAMMMTAAGTINAIKCLVLGAGVAGLQAIATAKRNGAIVSAYDVRSSAKEQIMSLGAKFIEVKSEEKMDSVYASEVSAEYKDKQDQLLREVIKNQDLVITTALIQGKKAPILIDDEMVNSMKAGSVIVDIAANNGGNCSLTKAGEIYHYNQKVKIIGYKNFASLVAFDASKLLAKNIYNFTELLIDKENQLNIDLSDEIIKSTKLDKVS